jgi:predicted AAA+ superfamily ATPase
MRGYNVDVGVVTANGKNSDGTSITKQLEVDFVCNFGSDRYYIQVAPLNLDTEEKRNQELASLRQIDDDFKKVVIVGGQSITYQNDEGIIFINIFDFMMNRGDFKI